MLLLLLVALLAPCRAGVARDPPGDAALCAEAIREVEASRRLPRGLLGAVALSESGRREPRAGRFVAWPWTVNNAGDGRYFATKEEAMAWVEELKRAGRRNIDVGCMQVNLMHHPDAFGDLGEALDPAANVGYGARFLEALRDETNSWDRAVERYHNAEPERGGAYRERVYAHWGGARGAAAAAPGGTGVGPRRPDLGGRGTGTGFLRLGRAPRFLPLVYGRPPARAAPLSGRRAPVVLGPSPPDARGSPGPGAIALGAGRAAGAARRPPPVAASLLAPAPGRIAVLTGAFRAAPAPRGLPGSAADREAPD